VAAVNPDPTRLEPGDTSPAMVERELVETIALEAVTTAPGPNSVTGPTLPRVAAAEPIGGEPEPAGDAYAMIGQRLGAYQIVARLGGGGMGSVYRAERVEGFEQQVAIKLIKRGMDSDALVRRFKSEIHFQAALGKHPNIAKLLDAGTIPDGRPYFVMEYVDGQRIDEYCDRGRLDIPARLRLFDRVCDAVQFAHERAVIHRDLKPGNILVTAEGVPKLIDFGIAKLMDPESAIGAPDGLDQLTRTGELVLTPDYASPEQVQGEPATTASDVYALGVVLYQLLTGRRPYRLKTRTTSEIFQAICEQAPERPSLAVVRGWVRSPRKAFHQPNARASAVELAPPGDSVTITAPAAQAEAAAAALSAQPAPQEIAANRGTTPVYSPLPEEIAADHGTTPAGLQRTLAGDLDMIVLMALRKEPERRYSSPAQLALDLRRHLEGLPVSARSDSTIYRVSRFMQRHAVGVTAAAAVLLALVAGVIGTSMGLVTARRERDRAEESSRQTRQTVDQFFTRVSEERLLNQPGLHPLRKQLLQDAQRFYEGFVAEHGKDPAVRAELALARNRLASITAEIGSLVEAEGRFQQAVALWDELLRADPGNHDYQEKLAHTLNEHAVVLMRLEGRRDEALGVCNRARALLEPLASAQSAPAPLRHTLGSVLLNIGNIQFQHSQPLAASETLERALAIFERLASEEPAALDPRIGMAKCHVLLGQIFLQQSDGIASALESYRQSINLREAIMREHPELPDQAYSLAADLGDLCSLQQLSGKLDSALATARRAVEVFEQLDRQFPGVLNYRGGLARTYNVVSDVYRRRGEQSESLASAEKARPMLERLIAEHPGEIDSHLDLAKTFNNIGRLHQQSGETAAALRSFQRAVDLFEALPELAARDRYNLACNLALCIPLIGAKEGSQGVLDSEAVGPSERIRRQIYADRAMEVLRKAVHGGFANQEILQSDPDLAAIRSRDDFQKIVKEIDEQPAGDSN
jgi:eukaryotic-like serine/threonine-protein kinase